MILFYFNHFAFDAFNAFLFTEAAQIFGVDGCIQVVSIINIGIGAGKKFIGERRLYFHTKITKVKIQA